MLPELEIENLSREELLKEAKRRKFNPTVAEKLLWQRLRRKRMLGFNFTRQHVCKNFIFDFYCHKLKLIIEVDYSVNDLLKDYYYERDLKHKELGYRVLRLNNDLVIDDYSNSISRIYKMVNYLVGLNKASEEKVDITISSSSELANDKHPIPGPSPREGKGIRDAGQKRLINQEEPPHFTVPRQTRNLLIEQAREMRKNPTKAESRLWGELRAKKLGGYKFRRQHPLGSFIVDFYCPLRKLVIEIDGPIHVSQKAYDDTREYYLKSMGYQVLRFDNLQVEHYLSGVLKEIMRGLMVNKEK